MIISDEMDQLIRDQEGWTRRMFEEGIRIKKMYGLDAVCDFSLGNPDTEPPVRKALIDMLSSPELVPIDICLTMDMKMYEKIIAEYSARSAWCSLWQVIL